jgi:hypothetical protein
VRYSGAFNQGRADRQAYNTWFAGLPKGSQEQQGALYWASTRGTPRAADGCYIAAVGGDHAQRWLDGCVKAKLMLDSFDHKRLTNADYRAGWNSL